VNVKSFTIAVIPQGSTHEFWKSIHAGAVKASQDEARNGVTVNIIWKGPMREDDREQQVQVVEGFVTQHVDGIVLAPFDKNALVRPVEEAKRAGIPTVVMDSGLPVTPAASVTRNLLRAADFLPALYAFGATSMLIRRDFKRLGDLAAGTLVVHASPVWLHADLPPATPAPPGRPLTLREQAAIVSWAGRASTLTAERLEELARLAHPAAAGGEASDTAALLGVAQWLVGRRNGEGS